MDEKEERIKGLRMFEAFLKIPRLSRQCVVTEKIDGINGQIYIGGDGEFLVGSRTRWITPEHDNHGFARWAHDHKGELVAGLGPGSHFGEWWGQGIQRGYGLKEKRFSLFNTARWGDDLIRPACCHVVPVITVGTFDRIDFGGVLASLSNFGSHAVPGFMDPEGIVIFHTAGNLMFKKTIVGDESPKGGGKR
jgi:hypothetical protein